MASGLVGRLLDYCYQRAIAPSSTGAASLAAEYADRSRSLEQNIDELIRWQNIKCATAGFMTGIGGFATLPITLPADIFANYYIQVRMIVAIALLCGHDVRSERVKSLVLLCLAGNATADVLKDAGTRMGRHAAERALVRATGRASFGKIVPLFGALLGAAVDAAACVAIGQAAKRAFLNGDGTKVAAP